jgi:hypothetical protein
MVAVVSSISTQRRVGLAALAMAATLLAVFWATRGRDAGPPIYDGLPLQTEPYRYLHPAPGQATTAPPTSASENVQPSNQGLPFIVNTNESPPQAELQADPDAFAIPPSTPNLTISITPVSPAAPIPNGRQDGNVYRTAVMLPGGAPVVVRPGKHITMYLRGTGALGKTVMDRFSDGRWTALATSLPGSGFHAADSDRLGDFTLVLVPGGGGLSSGVEAAIAVGAFLVVIALLLVAVRRLRQ